MKHARTAVISSSARRRRALAIGALALAAALAGCDRTPRDPAHEPPRPVTSAAPPVVGAGDASLPDAATALAAEARPSAPADPQTTNQRHPVTKAQESQSMPLPGQANDHSNTVADPKQGS